MRGQKIYLKFTKSNLKKYYWQHIHITTCYKPTSAFLDFYMYKNLFHRIGWGRFWDNTYICQEIRPQTNVAQLIPQSPSPLLPFVKWANEFVRINCTFALFTQPQTHMLVANGCSKLSLVKSLYLKKAHSLHVNHWYCDQGAISLKFLGGKLPPNW